MLAAAPGAHRADEKAARKAVEEAQAVRKAAEEAREKEAEAARKAANDAEAARRAEEEAEKRRAEEGEVSDPRDKRSLSISSSSSEERRRGGGRTRNPNPGKIAVGPRHDMAPEQREHWGARVQGVVTTGNKGFTDADLDKRFQASQVSNRNEKLMSEAELLTRSDLESPSDQLVLPARIQFPRI